MKTLRLLIIFCCFLFSCQHPGIRLPASLTIVESDLTIESKLLNRSYPYILVMPKGNFVRDLPVVYFLHGRGENRNSFQRLKGVRALRTQIERSGKPFVVVALTGSFDGKDSYWVNDSRADGYQMTDAILKEIIPAIEKKHRIGGAPSNRMIAGISMGSHGAFQLALNSNSGFKCVAGHSLVLRSYESFSAPTQFPGLFESYEDFLKMDPASLIKAYDQSHPPGFKKVWVDIGGADDKNFLKWARSFRLDLERVGFRKDRYKLDTGEDYPQGKHDSAYWQTRMPEYVAFYDSCFGQYLTNPFRK